MERSRVTELIPAALCTLGLLALSTLAFSRATRDEAFHKQGCICPVCNSASHRRWEGHHCLPRVLGGNDSLNNCVMVGGDRNRDCHEILDRKALDIGQIFVPETGGFIPIKEVPPDICKNNGPVIRVFDYITHRCKNRKERNVHRKKRGNKGKR